MNRLMEGSDPIYIKFLDKYFNVINDRNFIYPEFKEYYGTPVWAKFLWDLSRVGVDPLMDLTYIPEKFFETSNISNLEIPNKIAVIGKRAFSECKSLSHIIIPNSVTSIEKYAFYGCINLQNLEIPKSITYIGEEAFANCKNLSKVIYMGTIEECLSIGKGGNLFRWSPLEKLICKDGYIRI